MDYRATWEESDLLMLRGQPESARLEFKSSGLLAKDKQQTAIDDLTKEVSALANSEGGVIVIGMMERKEGKSRVADDLDEGVDAGQFSPEWLQQAVEGNLSPYLPGIRFRPVRLSGPRVGRVAFVIEVPKGTTAYQASDRRYYGRSEYQVRALPDHEIRLRMMRARVAQAVLEVREFTLATAKGKLAEWDAGVAAQKDLEERARTASDPGLALLAAMDDPSPRPEPTDDYSFRLVLSNVGEVTIRDFLLSLHFRHSGFLSIVWSSVGGVAEDPRSGLPEYRTVHNGGTLRCRLQHVAEGEAVFPGDCLAFPPATTWVVRVPEADGLRQAEVVFDWILYLDDAPSLSGRFDIGAMMVSAKAAEGQ